jgi:hypothetical protein
MINFKDLDLEQEETDLPESEDYLTDEQMCERIDSFDSENLANIIIAYKYLGLHKKVVPLAMQELAKRRSGGENFNFEEYIESGLKALPNINFKIPDFSGFFDLNEVVSSFAGFRKKS